MRKAILVALVCALVGLAGCELFRKTPTPTPDPAASVSPTSIIPSPLASPVPANGTAATTGTVSIQSVTGGKPGDTASVSVKAAPNTQCTLAFVAPPGSATVGRALEPKTADATGQVAWSWSIDSGTANGAGAITVRCGDALASSSIKIG